MVKGISYEAPHYAVFSSSSLFGPDILLNTLFSKTLSLCSSLNVRDQVSHSYRTTGKIVVL
jgi:polysaccharide pyruvyl transferase WcaK-like protein